MLGLRIKQLRIHKGYSLRGLARRARISPTYLRNIELGGKNPTIGTLQKIARALDVPLAVLVDDVA